MKDLTGGRARAFDQIAAGEERGIPRPRAQSGVRRGVRAALEVGGSDAVRLKQTQRPARVGAKAEGEGVEAQLAELRAQLKQRDALIALLQRELAALRRPAPPLEPPRGKLASVALPKPPSAPPVSRVPRRPRRLPETAETTSLDIDASEFLMPSESPPPLGPDLSGLASGAPLGPAPASLPAPVITASPPAWSNISEVPLLQRIRVSSARAGPSRCLPPAALYPQGEAFAVLEEDSGPGSGEDEDRRSESRLPCVFEVEFVSDTHFFAGLSLDISTGGLFVATYNVLPVGTELDLSFDLPGFGEVEARGCVRWTRAAEHPGSRPGIGIAFTQLSETALACIASFCELNPPRYVEL